MKQAVSGKVLSGDISLREKWTAAELTARLCKVLDFASRAVDCLGTEGFIPPDNTEQEEAVRPEKVVAETAFLLLAVHTCTPENNDITTRIHAIATTLVSHARSKKNFLAICLQPALALDYAQAHVCLTKIGYLDGAFDELLEKSMHATAHYGRERSPHRMLEQECMRRIWNADKYDPDLFHRLINYSMLGRQMDLLHGTRDDMYAFTHALMYATGFGLFHYSLPRARTEILAEAEAMLARCLDEQDYDLAGEVLLAWPLSGNTWSPVANFAFRVLMHVDEMAGFLPTPSTRLTTLNQLQGEEKQKYFYATAYHTVYVLGLLCATALQPGCAPDKNILTQAGAKPVAERLAEYLPSSYPHWRELFDKLDENECDACSSMLLNISLYRKVREPDYGTVLQLLQIADETGLSHLPLPQQTAELLSRLSLL
jgi:hypothetical protein